MERRRRREALYEGGTRAGYSMGMDGRWIQRDRGGSGITSIRYTNEFQVAVSRNLSQVEDFRLSA